MAGVLKESIWRRLCLGVGVLECVSGTVCDDGNAELEDSLIRYANFGVEKSSNKYLNSRLIRKFF